MNATPAWWRWWLTAQGSVPDLNTAREKKSCGVHALFQSQGLHAKTPLLWNNDTAAEESASSVVAQNVVI